MPAAGSAARRERSEPHGNQRKRKVSDLPSPARATRTPARKPEAAARKRPARTGKSPRSSKAQAVRTSLRYDPAYFVLLPTAALLLLGLVMVFSAGSIIGMDQNIGGYRYFLQQLSWAALGLGLLVFFWKFDYHKLGKASWAGVLISMVLLVMVLFAGRSVYGSKRWLSLGPVNIQPTEIAKFTLVIFAAYVLAMKGDRLKQIFHLLVPVVVVTIIEAALILRQPDLGSALVMCFSIMVLLIVAKTKGRHLAAIAAVGLGSAVLFAVTAPYRLRRILAFLNPWSDPRGAGYQVIQSYVALGSGSIKGLGLGMSRQKFLYLPNAHTDFIFAIIGEELGLIGTMVVLFLLGILAYGGMKIAQMAPDDLGRLLAAGITGLIIIQALVNMGGVTGLLPITGVPLPLVSSGGSSLCVCMGCIGVLLNIATQGHR